MNRLEIKTQLRELAKSQVITEESMRKQKDKEDTGDNEESFMYSVGDLEK